MSYKTIKTGSTPEIFITDIQGSLVVKGWDSDEVAVRGDQEDEIEFDAQADTVRLSSRGDCVVRLPLGATLHVGSLHGDARFKLLEDQLTIDQAYGSLTLSSVAGVNVSQIHGNLFAKHMAGDFHGESVHGNVVVRDIQGDLYLGRVEGNLDLREAEGSVFASASGNARLRLSSLGGEQYQVSADGNLECRLESSASALADLSSGSSMILVRLPDGGKQVIREPHYSLNLGEGGPSLTLKAGGVMTFRSQEIDLEDLEETAGELGEEFGGFSEEFSQQIAEQIEQQVEAQMEMLSRQLNEQMANLANMASQSGMSQERMDQIMQRARESSERAAARAQEKMRRTQERLERKFSAAQRKAEAKARAAERRSSRAWNFEWSTPPVPPAPPASPAPPSSTRFQGPPPPPNPTVSDEERLMILRMLEQKKITAEEAEKLLAAMEGRSE